MEMADSRQSPNTQCYLQAKKTVIATVSVSFSPMKLQVGYNLFNDRIISVRINARRHNISIIHFYAPTSASMEEEIEEFYSQIQEVIDKIPSRDVTLIMGDANAKVGKADIPSVTYGQYRLGVRNVRGSVLIDFYMTNDLVISNTCFNHHPRRLYTWNSPDGTTRN